MTTTDSNESAGSKTAHRAILLLPISYLIISTSQYFINQLHSEAAAASMSNWLKKFCNVQMIMSKVITIILCYYKTCAI